VKIALMGSAPSSRNLAPFNDQNWEIWSCSPPNFDLPRVDAWFELHNLDRKIAPPANRPYIETIMQHPRVYITQKDPRFPNAIEFPWKPLVEKYGRDFFSSSLSWMMAFAIEQKPEKIGLWGVDMSANEEYGQQRPGLKFFMREAKKAGIGVYAPPQSDIMQPMPLYGIKEHTRYFAKQKARKAELEGRIAAANEAKTKAEREMLVLTGALDDMRYMNQTYDGIEWDGANAD
jgi:hypothetical protein